MYRLLVKTVCQILGCEWPFGFDTCQLSPSHYQGNLCSQQDPLCGIFWWIKRQQNYLVVALGFYFLHMPNPPHPHQHSQHTPPTALHVHVPVTSTAGLQEVCCLLIQKRLNRNWPVKALFGTARYTNILSTSVAFECTYRIHMYVEFFFTPSLIWGCKKPWNEKPLQFCVHVYTFHV